MTNYDRLIQYFEGFPGIGTRQAKRFVNHLLVMSDSDRSQLSELVRDIKGSVATCKECFRFYTTNGNTDGVCTICSNPERDRTKLMVVERDSDLLSVERAGTYDGLYFVLGGTIPLLSDDETKKLRGGALKQIVESRTTEGLSEIILAFSVNPDGENTARYINTLLKDLITEHSLTITTLGRGLSTGSELEYADPETIKSALSNRG